MKLPPQEDFAGWLAYKAAGCPHFADFARARQRVEGILKRYRVAYDTVSFVNVTAWGCTDRVVTIRRHGKVIGIGVA